MRSVLKLLRTQLALGALAVFLSSPLVAQDEPAAEEAAQYEVVVDEAPSAEASAIMDPIAVEVFADPSQQQAGGGYASETATARLLLQLAGEEGAQERNTQLMTRYWDVLRLAPPAQAYWFSHPTATPPMQVMVIGTADPRHPQVVRVIPRVAAGGGAVAAYFDAATGEEITGEDLSSQQQWEPGQYMIGVSLSVIDSEILRRHLSIDEGVGLVVDEVFENSPAQAAGVQVGDILLKVGDTALKSPQDLVAAVQTFSTDSGDALSIEIIQAGERKTLEITPTTRQELLGYDLVQPVENPIVWQALVRPGGEDVSYSQLLMAPQVAWAQVQQPDDLSASIQSLSEQVARLQEAIDRLEQRLGDE
jgi:hypothetical protein